MTKRPDDLDVGDRAIDSVLSRLRHLTPDNAVRVLAACLIGKLNVSQGSEVTRAQRQEIVHIMEIFQRDAGALVGALGKERASA